MAASEVGRRRGATLDRLAARPVNLLVIGAGIVGSRVAYEAASRGLQVALVDAGDFGGGSSSGSSKLLHGGVRYLATGDLRLVRALQAERRAVTTRIAPHLVRPLRLLLAVERGEERLMPKLLAALAVYAGLSGGRRPRPRLLGPGAAAELAPVEKGRIRACGLIHEAATHDARLTLATVRAAAGAGATVLNYVRVADLEQAAGRVVAAVLEDALTGARLTVRCDAVVCAAGPWLDSVRRLEDPRARPQTRLSKGVHVFLPLEGGWQAGVALFDGSRSAFAIPWQGMLMVGTTDTPFEGDPASVAPEPGELDALVGSFAGLLPAGAGLRGDRVVHATAALRVLRRDPGDTATASRRHVLGVGRGGMVSIAGGKLTAHRRIAVEALAELPASVRPRRLSRAYDPLPSARGLDVAAGRLGRSLDANTAAHLLHLYGAEATRLLAYADSDPGALEPIRPGGPDVWAQALYAVDEEWAVTADDVACRRTTLAVRGLADEPVLDELGALTGLEDAPAGQRPALRR